MSDGASLLDWIALHLLPGFGPTLTQRALNRFGSPRAVAFDVEPNQFRALAGFSVGGVGALRKARRDLRRRAEFELEQCRRFGITPLPWNDADYPAALREIPDPPPLLYVRGRLQPGLVRAAVIGSRSPTNYGKRLALGLAGGLAGRGVEVVAGGARGIDGLAHRGTLEADGRTVAVLGSGLLRPYPPEHASLFERIADAGAVVSEFPLEQEPARGHFPRRNRLISGLSAAVVVVEAATKSGSLSTATHALEQGREVLAVPGPVSSSRSVGCHRLIQQGARLVQRIDDILDELPPIYRRAVGPAQNGPPAPAVVLDGDERLVFEALDEVEPVHVDELARRLPLSVARLQTALFGLELRSAIERNPGGFFVRKPADEPPR